MNAGTAIWRVSMRVRPAALVQLLGLLALVISEPAYAESKLAILKVKGMICNS